MGQIYNPPTLAALGGGTAATKNTGVSGDAVPVLNLNGTDYKFLCLAA